MNTLWIVLLTLVMFGLIIFAHEGGHLLCAKACHIYVEEFSVGMGPKLFGFRKGETMYSLRLLPIGGYCKMPGEDGESQHPNGFDKKNVPQRMLVVAGGALFNFIFAMILFVVAYMMLGAPATEPLIGSVVENSPAAVAGLEKNDVITAIDGKKTATWDEATSIIKASANQELTFTIARDEKSFDVQITPKVSQDNGAVIGVVLGNEKLSLFGAIQKGFQQTYDLTKLILVTLFQMITGQTAVELAGPVGVGQMVGQVANYGILNFII